VVVGGVRGTLPRHDVPGGGAFHRGLGAIAFVRGVRRHRRALPLVLGASGLSLMASALVVSHGAHHLMESALTIVGVSVLALAHLFNRQEPA
jgi:hypothetical protein